MSRWSSVVGRRSVVGGRSFNFIEQLWYHPYARCLRGSLGWSLAGERDKTRRDEMECSLTGEEERGTSVVGGGVEVSPELLR